ncbi:MGH1-like glycoside hydrolase domain-containing protein [Candidatus Protochlamydia phocaeensis]|uniref:MGH1-like glycoside hydrolase domain-containing protein n=1 Tax=Candidatus Protochlamydia phocaeensis TaxID=1414722 RepID=UPI0008384259|nr:glucosidase [Candidatus Protochlamydia phocaeensis]
MQLTPEHLRLTEHHEHKANWRKWGPYLSERAWGTVREDYSENGEAWDYFPHDHARSRAYRWNEDGIGGISDRYHYLCFALGLWNEKDPILKERFFGLNPKEGNHGEDVKEYYFYLDNTPTHSYMKMLYKYPQQAYPYNQLIQENQKRSSHEPEYELLDTGIFDQHRYFDVWIEYAKNSTDDILIKMTAVNRGPDPAPLHLLPTLWFRNTWSWGYANGPMGDMASKPLLFAKNQGSFSGIQADHSAAGTYYLYAEGNPEWIFTENETNRERLYNSPNPTPYVKDAFDRFLIHRQKEAINPEKKGTKTAAHFSFLIPSQQTISIRLRLSKKSQVDPFADFDSIFSARQKEADQFYEAIHNSILDEDERRVQRQAFASLLWTKQMYYYDIEQWLEGDPNCPPVQRALSRNKDWIHLVNFDVISMPDKWEYPWYASWDLSFHCIPLTLIDPDFAKRQLILMTREWYTHPNGQLPAYEWNFSDVNPPVLAWSAWRLYKIDGKQAGKPDRNFLEAIFHKLLLNFTWWVNQKDKFGHNVFQGGFLGLDNISIFDRSTPLEQGHIDQSDGTAWMGFYCILMMKIAIELARTDPVYQDCATKFFEHFLRIASAMINPERKGFALWYEEDGFFYDTLHINSTVIPLRIRSIMGLLPLFAVETIDARILDNLPIFKQRMEWFLSQRPNYTSTMTCEQDPAKGERRLMAILTKERLLSTLRYMLDENEFLSPYGIRSLSKYHQDHPYTLTINGAQHCIGYQPGEAVYRMIAGGNSNWRGPIWFPLNFLIIESLQKFHYYYGETLKVEFPTGSGNWLNLGQVATELSIRLIALFLKNSNGARPIYPEKSLFNQDTHWQDLILFHEFFHGDHGMGLGASHQTGWTALVAKLLQQSGGEN